MKQDPLAGWLLSVWLGLAGESAGVRPATCRLQGGGGGRKGDLQPREPLHMPGAEKPLTLTRASADPPTARTRPERPPLIPLGAGMGRVGAALLMQMAPEAVAHQACMGQQRHAGQMCAGGAGSRVQKET